MEIWKIINDYPNYMISSIGRVKRLNNGYYRRTEKILIPQLQSNGYLHIKLSQNGKSKCFLLHRLVAKAFLNNPNNLPQVNHINEDKTDIGLKIWNGVIENIILIMVMVLAKELKLIKKMALMKK